MANWEGQRDIIIENMNCKSFSETPLWSDMMTQILSKYQGEKHPGQIIFIGSGSMGGLFVTKGFDADKSAGHVSLASSNIVILPKDTVKNLDSWMPESVDIFLLTTWIFRNSNRALSISMI